jgi:hypothetical protein
MRQMDEDGAQSLQHTAASRVMSRLAGDAWPPRIDAKDGVWLVAAAQRRRMSAPSAGDGCMVHVDWTVSNSLHDDAGVVTLTCRACTRGILSDQR